MGGPCDAVDRPHVYPEALERLKHLLAEAAAKKDASPSVSTLPSMRGSIPRTMQSVLEGSRVSVVAKFGEEMQIEFKEAM